MIALGCRRRMPHGERYYLCARCVQEMSAWVKWSLGPDGWAIKFSRITV